MDGITTITNTKENLINNFKHVEGETVQVDNEISYIRHVYCDTTRWNSNFKCAVPSCESEFNIISNKLGELTHKFHHFPEAEHVANVWKQLCGLPLSLDVTNLKVCTNHFNITDYDKLQQDLTGGSGYKYILKHEAIPIKRMPVIDPDLEAIRNVVDLNEALKVKHDTLLDEQAKLKDTIIKYTKKIENKHRQLLKLKKTFIGYKKQTRTYKKQQNYINVINKVFSSAQIDILKGMRNVNWTEDDLALAFSLRHVGTKECYLYLKNTLNIPLPSLAAVQKWAASL